MLTGRPILRLLGLRTFWLFAGIFGLIEAIYVVEEFTSLIEFIVANGGSVIDTIVLAFLKTPEVVDFALPIAIFVALYFAILGTRESNELMVCASAGVPWTRIPRFAFGVGVCGVLVSLLFASVITPTAAYTFRITAQTLEGTNAIREIVEPGPKNAIRTIQDHAFIATPPKDPDAVRGNLFIFEPDKGDGWRASQAEDWSVVGPRPDGSHAIELKSYRDYVGRTPEQLAALEASAGTLQGTLQTAQWDVQNVSLVLRLEELIRPIDRAAHGNERLLIPAMLGAVRTWQSASAVIEPRVGEITGRALGCLFAALLAVAAAAWSGTRLGRYASIPLSIAVILGADVLLRTTLSDATAQGTVGFAQSTMICAAIVSALPLAYVFLRREAIIVPRRGQD